MSNKLNKPVRENATTRHSRAVNPPGHQILRIDRREMKEDVISHDKWPHLCQKCSLIPIDVYSTSFSTLWLKLQWRTRIYGETFRVTVAQTTQNIWKLTVGKSSVQEIATLAIIREISDSNPETGRYSPKSGVFRIIRESWQHCITWELLAPGYGLRLITIKICLCVLNAKLIENPDVSGLLSLHQWKMPLHWTRVILFKCGNIWSARWKSSLK